MGKQRALRQIFHITFIISHFSSMALLNRGNKRKPDRGFDEK